MYPTRVNNHWFFKSEFCSLVTARNHRGSSTPVADEVTGAVQEALLEPVALEHPAGLLGGSGDGASYRSSSAGGVAWSRGAVARAGATRGHLSPSSPLLRVSSPACAPWRAGFGTKF